MFPGGRAGFLLGIFGQTSLGLGSRILMLRRSKLGCPKKRIREKTK